MNARSLAFLALAGLLVLAGVGILAVLLLDRAPRTPAAGSATTASPDASAGPSPATSWMIAVTSTEPVGTPPSDAPPAPGPQAR